MPEVKSVSVSLSLPFLSVGGTWEPDRAERDAAWELYVELVTRVAVTPLGQGEGMLREALDSLYAIFDRTREVLKKYGPSVARPSGGGDLSLGYIAVAVLNGAIRPVLSNWHPELMSYEHTRPDHVSRREHEVAWDMNQALRGELADLSQSLKQYADLLATVANVPPLAVTET